MLLLALAASQLNEHGSLGEADVNEILKNWLGAFCSPYVVDHVTIRRYLVDTRLLERNSEGSCYQVVDANVDQLIDRNARVIEPVRVLAEIEEQREQRKQRRQHG